MNSELLTKQFAKMGSRIQLEERTFGYEVDVGEDKSGEYFVIRANPDSFDVNVVNLAPEDRHLILMVQDKFNPVADKFKFLCGHDERHWFAAALPSRHGISNVREAKEALKPQPAHDSQRKHQVKRKKRNKRKNEGFIRQGEWFFIPEPFTPPNANWILKNEPIVRGSGGKPHLVEELYREGGTAVYVNRRFPNGLTEGEYQAYRHQHPKSKETFTRTLANPKVYARGKVRHPDHATIRLSGWHRVEPNTENEARGFEHLRFID